MGLEFLELTFLVEKEFELKLSRSDWDALFEDNALPHDSGRASDLQVDTLLRWVTRKCLKQHGTVPDDLWPRLQHCLIRCSGCDREEIELQTWLVRDLDFG